MTPTSRSVILRAEFRLPCACWHLKDTPMELSPASTLDLFHPAVAAWFSGRFGAPTEPQRRAWPSIREGRHTLIAAPTGSGKTLAAFLAAIDDLVRRGLLGDLEETVQVVYVSPL